MNGLWWFIAGWLSAAVVVAILLLHRRSPEWLDAQNSVHFALCCEEFVDTYHHFAPTQPQRDWPPAATRFADAMTFEPVKVVR